MQEADCRCFVEVVVVIVVVVLLLLLLVAMTVEANVMVVVRVIGMATAQGEVGRVMVRRAARGTTRAPAWVCVER